jgi:hypothetical protein
MTELTNIYKEEEEYEKEEMIEVNIDFRFEIDFIQHMNYLMRQYPNLWGEYNFILKGMYKCDVVKYSSDKYPEKGYYIQPAIFVGEAALWPEIDKYKEYPHLIVLRRIGDPSIDRMVKDKRYMRMTLEKALTTIKDVATRGYIFVKPQLYSLDYGKDMIEKGWFNVIEEK